MSINDISTCLIGGRSCGVGREEDASNLLWCEHCGIALCFDCDTDLHNSKNLKHGHLRVLLPASRTETVRKCEHGADGSTNVRLGLITKPSPPKNKRRSAKKERGVSSRSSSSSPHNDDDGDGIVKASETIELSSIETSEKAASVCVFSFPCSLSYEIFFVNIMNFFRNCIVFHFRCIDCNLIFYGMCMCRAR